MPAETSFADVADVETRALQAEYRARGAEGELAMARREAAACRSLSDQSARQLSAFRAEAEKIIRGLVGRAKAAEEAQREAELRAAGALPTAQTPPPDELVALRSALQTSDAELRRLEAALSQGDAATRDAKAVHLDLFRRAEAAEARAVSALAAAEAARQELHVSEDCRDQLARRLAEADAAVASAGKTSEDATVEVMRLRHEAAAAAEEAQRAATDSAELRSRILPPLRASALAADGLCRTVDELLDATAELSEGGAGPAPGGRDAGSDAAGRPAFSCWPDTATDAALSEAPGPLMALVALRLRDALSLAQEDCALVARGVQEAARARGRSAQRMEDLAAADAALRDELSAARRISADLEARLAAETRRAEDAEQRAAAGAKFVDDAVRLGEDRVAKARTAAAHRHELERSNAALVRQLEETCAGLRASERRRQEAEGALHAAEAAEAEHRAHAAAAVDGQRDAERRAAALAAELEEASGATARLRDGARTTQGRTAGLEAALAAAERRAQVLEQQLEAAERGAAAAAARETFLRDDAEDLRRRLDGAAALPPAVPEGSAVKGRGEAAPRPLIAVPSPQRRPAALGPVASPSASPMTEQRAPGAGAAGVAGLGEWEHRISALLAAP